MGKFNDSFKLNVKEIALIEDALREQVNHLSRAYLIGDAKPDESIDEKIKSINDLLGNIHNQKIWYGQTNKTGVPLG